MFFRWLQHFAALLIIISVAAVIMYAMDRHLSDNRCKMTYMYRFMHFMPIDISGKSSLPSNDDYRFSTDYSAYKTILYGEGSYAVEFSYSGDVGSLRGIPVIFVPGNGGSSKQVRSLGTVLQNKTEMQRTPFTFDVFAVDFNEELSGLSGMYIERQTRYLEIVINYIWRSYKPSPRRIILVGHSMGGIVIRSLVRCSGFDFSRIAMILTLSTPHLSPTVLTDHFMEQVYEDIKRNWPEVRRNYPHLRIISFSGGLKDLMVPEYLCNSEDVSHFSTAAINGIELEADHLCMVWCNQLVRLTSRILFEYGESPESFQENIDSVIHNTAMLLDRSETSSPPEFVSITITIPVDLEKVSEVVNEENRSSWYRLSVIESGRLFLMSKGGKFFKSGKAVSDLHIWKENRYALISCEQPVVIHVMLKAGEKLRMAFFSNSVLDSADLVFPSVWSLLPVSSCNRIIKINGSEIAKLVPFRVRSLGIAVEAQLYPAYCPTGEMPPSRIEFLYEKSRRTSYYSNDGSERIIGYRLSKKVERAAFLFILDPRCRYVAEISIGFLDSVFLMLQTSAAKMALLFTSYILYLFYFIFLLDVTDFSPLISYSCSFIFSLSAYFVMASLLIANDAFLIITTSFLYFVLLLVFHYLKWFLTAVFLMLRLPVYYDSHSRNSSASRSSRTLPLLSFSMLLLSLLINYFWNGFLALGILVPLSYMRLNVQIRLEQSSLISLSSLVFVMHALIIIFTLPFGICSIWNLLKYGASSLYVFEDPARRPSYLFIIMIAIQLLYLRNSKRYMFKHISPIKHLIHLTLFLPLIMKETLSQLCCIMVFYVTILPFFIASRYSASTKMVNSLHSEKTNVRQRRTQSC
ncbi:hypothetical protein AB6A40_005017 [Gnathostoma spinigerum]|uniref:GPI inositol-deacylase n=1 Tax=Gnathostoma spinigerum TaxID=75299 RepID=A0ABD6EE89_9BILA